MRAITSGHFSAPRAALVRISSAPNIPFGESALDAEVALLIELDTAGCRACTGLQIAATRSKAKDIRTLIELDGRLSCRSG